MAWDLWKKKQTGKDWSIGDDIGSTDLPKSAHNYEPKSFWGPDQMEAKVAQFMSKPQGFLSSTKPTRAEAIELLKNHMKANKIGPMNVS